MQKKVSWNFSGIGTPEQGPWISHLLQEILGGNCLEHIFLGGFLDLPTQQEFVQHEVGLLKVKDDVEFADRAEIFVEQLHVTMDYLQNDQLIVAFFDGTAKIKTGVSGEGEKLF